MGDDLRVTVWVDGKLVSDDTMTNDVDQAGKLGRAHLEIAREADEAGKRWLVQIEDPNLPEDRRFVRFGNDTQGMVDPQPVDDLGGEILRRAES